MNDTQVKQSHNKVKVLGVGVASTELVEVLTKVDEFVRKNHKLKLIVTVNPEFVMLAQEDEEFKKILNGADLAIADGVGLKLAGVRNIVPGRRIVEALLQKGYKVFYLGSRVASEMAKKYGGAYDDGEKSIRAGERESKRIVAKINKYKPDILLVAYGAPWQEKWLWANRSKIKAKVGMGVGGAFDYLTGRVKLPPEWINKIGLEWLWRLVHERWRWRRQLRLLRFVWLLGKNFIFTK
ncbi:MAG: Glycosyl transferase, WecB/TagA/CpsF family [Candidatus Amesbacteria bacterium GW2011_GWA1_46_35]|uniref:Glycosyl transferase, WecB/TagA/CpsF family n=1 Tax=Candidatus Amesbacteria bacterium GW2011_GWC2_45_19 TaxID=1618366 RepID=A0A0G1Q260_9BACT|nr:MAG: Glycosyl transferase, WecB/TagA/CpsF family [Candidatus Amesbacteria bacterium GW2011_GWC2_45_19]KKU37621.1 MAG: Glycosyl transferase, WecB/TagA/CpsF family [Candidatus Amesbacteria bacterium GW2011_GWA1_46_35]KKU68471.1 MAG: N-acetylmannosaminyltransferase, N-acetylglucosaminyldiphosphoundecaprenol [Microgenomates group bacterium GW2011_GWC1_47_20]